MLGWVLPSGLEGDRAVSSPVPPSTPEALTLAETQQPELAGLLRSSGQTLWFSTAELRPREEKKLAQGHTAS